MEYKLEDIKFALDYCYPEDSNKVLKIDEDYVPADDAKWSALYINLNKVRFKIWLNLSVCGYSVLQYFYQIL